jgi:hypothetical protein
LFAGAAQKDDEAHQAATPTAVIAIGVSGNCARRES